MRDALRERRATRRGVLQAEPASTGARARASTRRSVSVPNSLGPALRAILGARGGDGDPACGRSAERSRVLSGQAACKPGSVPGRVSGGRWPFLWDVRCRTPRATYPDDWPGNRPSRRSGSVVPTWSCSRWGLPCRPRRRRRGALLPHPFTLTRRHRPGRADCSLWHFPWGRPRRALPGTVFPWSPDFPPPGRPGSGHPAA